jgi:hypothetical protein
MTADEVDVCDFDPGYEVAVSVTGPVRQMVGIWRGDLGWPAALRSGSIQLQGPERLRRAVPTWFPPSELLRCVARRLILVLWPAKSAAGRE